MASGHESRSETALTQDERERLALIRSASSLSELAMALGSDSEHDAYLEAKSVWADLRETELSGADTAEGIAGDAVRYDGQRFVVHGFTHADTPAERAFLREHVSQFLDAGDDVYCEQGTRSMYFEEFPGVYEMDDYRWAMSHCQRLGLDSHLDQFENGEFDGLGEDLSSVVSQFREAAFSLIESGSDVYGDGFASALGDVASEFLMSHEQIATAEDFEAFKLSREAAHNPEKLADLQRYYKQVMLPQPLEREWLRRHDRELEIVTHARNERMADYAVYHGDSDTVRLFVGAAHQPGVVYYLNEYREGNRSRDAFVPVEGDTDTDACF